MVKTIRSDIVFYLIVFIILFVVLMLSIRISTTICGKDLRIWLGIYVGLYFIKILHTLVSFILIHKNNPKIKSFNLIKFILVNPLQLGWLTYGNIIFYQFIPEENCKTANISDINRLTTFILIVLILGYI